MERDNAIVTVVTSDYLHFASALVESIRQYDKSISIFVCVVDLENGELPKDEHSISYITGSDLKVPKWKRMAFQYSGKELSAALKSFAVDYLFSHGFSKVVLLDSDIHVYDSLEQIFEELEQTSLLLTPHWLEPGPEDGIFPSACDIRLYGVYNTGFMGFRLTNETLAFVDWWKDRCYSNCIIDIPAGRFVDQSWVDLAPCFVADCHIARHPGWNVAYWNLPGRRLATSKDGIEVNGKPLVFFHFSGFDPNDATRLSKYSKRNEYQSQLIVKQIATEYGARLLDKQNFFNYEYRFKRLKDGKEIKPEWRQAVRLNLPLLDNIENPFDSLCSIQGFEKLQAIENSIRPKESVALKIRRRLKNQFLNL